MRLIEMKIENFRQFYGNHTLHFSSEEKDNITVLIGRNGEGKTGIFRAINFCLYNMMILEQDDKNTPVHLVNFKVLEENKSKAVSAVVEVKLTHEGQTYLIKRSIREIKMDNGVIERDPDSKVELRIFDKHGNMDTKIIKDLEEVEKKLAFLSHQIKDFFFFDGEKIEKLAETNRRTRNDIKNGIIKLLDIDILDRAASAMKKIHNDQRNTMKAISKDNKKLQSAYKKRDELQEEILNLIEDKDLKNEELSGNKEEQEKYENKMAEHRDINILFDKKKEQSNIKREKESNLELRKQQIRPLLKNYSQALIVNDFLNISKEFINQEMGQGSQNIVGITTQLLDEILAQRKCICGNRVDNGNDEYNVIKNLKEAAEKNELHSFLNQYNHELSIFFNQRDEISESIKNEMKNIQTVKNEILEIERKIEAIDEKIKHTGQKQIDLQKYQQSLERLKIDEKELIKNIARLEERLKQLVKDSEDIDKEIKDLEKDEVRLQKETQKEFYINELQDMFNNIIQKYSIQVRSQLSEHSSSLFKKLIATRDKELLRKININDDYEIEALDQHSNSILQDVSKGQRHMVALSFVTALVKVASGGEGTIDMPLFMDSPFGRLDGENRENLIREIPALTSQWILLVTDRELISSEFQVLKNTGRLGKIYKIEKTDEYMSKIEEIDRISITA